MHCECVSSILDLAFHFLNGVFDEQQFWIQMKSNLLFFNSSLRVHVCVCVCVCVLSRVWLFATPWTIACQVPLFMEFSRQVYWSKLPFPSPGDVPDPGIKPVSPAYPALTADSLPLGQMGSQISSLCSLFCSWELISYIRFPLPRDFSLFHNC